MQFSDSINENLELLQQVLGNATPGQKERAKRVATQISDVVENIRKDGGKDPAAGVGVAFAVMYIAQNMVQGGTVREDGPRIWLPGS